MSTDMMKISADITRRNWTADPRKVAHLVLERIETFPETYHQPQWLGQRQKNGYVKAWGPNLYSRMPINNLPALSASAWSDCGTTGCVAGHTSAVAVELGMFPPTSQMDVDNMAEEALQLSEREANWLFHGKRSLEEVKTALNTIISGEAL